MVALGRAVAVRDIASRFDCAFSNRMQILRTLRCKCCRTHPSRTCENRRLWRAEATRTNYKKTVESDPDLPDVT